MSLRRFFPSTVRGVEPVGTAFISTWNTANTFSGSSASDQVKLPLTSNGVYDFTADWGDGNEDLITAWNQAEVTHTYASAGTYTITITGTIKGWEFGNTGDRLKFLDVSSWGPLDINNISAFFGCANMNFSALDSPTLSITSLQNFFRSCTNFNSSINHWDVSGITNLTTCFQDCAKFNQPLNNWNVSNVSSFSGLFFQAFDFNQNIGGWNVSNSLSFSQTFFRAESFNQDISGWNVSNCTNFQQMFLLANSFNQNIGGWNVSNSLSFSRMFERCPLFNQDISGWNVSNCTNFQQMFDRATNFDQNIGGWDVSSGTVFTNFMNGKSSSNFSASNLDAIYNGWSALPSISPNESISFGTAKYTAAGQAGRDILTGAPNNWTILDGGI